MIRAVTKMSAEQTQKMYWGFQILPQAIIVRIFGKVDQTIGEVFEQATERATNLKDRRVVLDFSDIDSMDSVGLLLCGHGLHHLKQLSIPVALIKPPASLFPLLQKYGLPEVSPVFLDPDSVSKLL